MTDYSELWRQIESRLRSATMLLAADNVALANKLGAEVGEWLNHNELELALDQLLAVLDDGHAAVRRRVWDELAVSALLMRLNRQFILIADRIPDLGPHVLGAEHEPPYVQCDFNGRISDELYSLNSVGTALDFARLRLVPYRSQDLILYDEDADEDGTPTWLTAAARLVEHQPFGLVACVPPGSFRTRPR
jgi:hypothetical protein